MLSNSRLSSLCVTLVIVLLLEPKTIEAQEERTMPKNLDAVDALLDLPDERFYRLSESRRDKLIEKAADLDFLGIRVRAPRVVEFARRKSLPVLYLRRTTGLRDWQLEFERNSTLVGVDLSSGIARASWAFPTHKRFDPNRLPKSLAGEEPEGPERASTNTDIYELDAKSILHLPWQPGKWALTIINYDHASNTAVVRLSGGRSEAGGDIEPIPRNEAARILASLGETLERFEPSDRSPVLENEGASLAIEAVGDGRVLVHGTVRVPVPAAALVAGGSEIERERRLPKAILTAMLLVVTRDELSHPRLDLRLPVFTDDAPGPGQIVEAHFVQELEPMVDKAFPDDPILLYLIAGRHVGGPYTVRFHDLPSKE